MYFMIAITFEAGYVYQFNPKVPLYRTLVKGALFGFLVFIFAEVMLFIRGKLMPIPMENNNMMLMMLASPIGHLVFGIVIALIVPAVEIDNFKNNFSSDKKFL